MGSVTSFHELQNERLDTCGFFEAINRRDIRVVERGEKLRFAFEAREPIGIAGESFRQNFQRHVAIELGVSGAIHLTHPACSQECEHFIGAETSA